MRASIVVLILLVSAGSTSGQKAIIPNGTPAAVLEVLKANLLPQGFTLQSSDEKGALFSCDRGLVEQSSGLYQRSAHVIIELRIKYKQEKEGLEVEAMQYALDALSGNRKRIDSREDLASLQRLLDTVQADPKSRPAPADSAARHDSKGHPLERRS